MLTDAQKRAIQAQRERHRAAGLVPFELWIDPATRRRLKGLGGGLWRSGPGCCAGPWICSSGPRA